MIKKIAQQLIIFSDSKQSLTEQIIIAEQILTMQEKLGMLPPTAELKNLNMVDNAWESE